MQKETFTGWEIVTLRPKDPAALQSETKQIAGWGAEVVSGGGDGVEISFAGLNQDPFADAARRGAARPGELHIGQFSRLGVTWPATGVTGATTRAVKLRVYKDRGIARVHLLSGDMLMSERKLVKLNTHTAMGGNLAAGSRHLIWQTSDYLPAKDDHFTTPGLGVPFREEEGFLEIVLGASGAVDGTGITQAPKLIILAQHTLNNVVGARSLWWYASLSQRPSGTGHPSTWSTSWQWSFIPSAINLAGAANQPILNRIPCPPNGVRIELFNPSENTEALQWESQVYVRGQ